jgi:hypothetical protein
MGGGQKVQQTNAAQAAAANAGATGAANNASALSAQYNQQQQQQYNNLFGANGKGGAVGGFLDPSKLNVTGPTGPYALQFTREKENLAKGYQDAAGATTRNLAQSGFGPNTPSGFGANLQAQNARGLANATGDAFANATGNSYQDALSNFWKSAAMAQQQGTAAQGGALQGNNTAAQTYGNLYGTAGHGNVTQSSNLMGNLIGAGGQVGAAAVCCVAGTLVRMADGTDKPVEFLKEGDELASCDGGKEVVVGMKKAFRNTVRIRTTDGYVLQCSNEHALLRDTCGYVDARDSLDEIVRAEKGLTTVNRVETSNGALVFSPELSRTHTYLANGLWSEGW